MALPSKDVSDCRGAQVENFLTVSNVNSISSEANRINHGLRANQIGLYSIYYSNVLNICTLLIYTVFSVLLFIFCFS